MKAILNAALFSILMISCASSSRTHENTKSLAMEEYGEHLMRYFQNKNDDIIYETISIYKDDEKSAEMLEMIDSTILFFFYGIKNDNSKRYNNFRKIVQDSKIERLIYIFDAIEETDMAAYLAEQDASPDLNDVYWTLYFSSGDTKYLNHLFKTVMDYHDETENQNYFLAARSAMWSLSVNMRFFPSLSEHIQNNSILSDDMREYILHTDPHKIQSDTTMQLIYEW